MADWQKKKDYETAQQWKERVTPENREKKLDEVIDNVRKNYIAAYTTNMVKGNLGVYDTDYGTYRFPLMAWDASMPRCLPRRLISSRDIGTRFSLNLSMV